jgi:hypothetical protein
MKAVAASVMVLLVACSSGTKSPGPRPQGSRPSDPAGLDACTAFRAVSRDAYTGSMAHSSVVSSVKDVGSKAAPSTNQAIRSNAQAMAADAERTATALENGDANEAADALADTCNAAYPLVKPTEGS